MRASNLNVTTLFLLGIHCKIFNLIKDPNLLFSKLKIVHRKLNVTAVKTYDPGVSKPMNK